MHPFCISYFYLAVDKSPTYICKNRCRLKKYQKITWNGTFVRSEQTFCHLCNFVAEWNFVYFDT